MRHRYLTFIEVWLKEGVISADRQLVETFLRAHVLEIKDVLHLLANRENLLRDETLVERIGEGLNVFSLLREILALEQHTLLHTEVADLAFKSALDQLFSLGETSDKSIVGGGELLSGEGLELVNWIGR